MPPPMPEVRLMPTVSLTIRFTGCFCDCCPPKDSKYRKVNESGRVWQNRRPQNLGIDKKGRGGGGGGQTPAKISLVDLT